MSIWLVLGIIVAFFGLLLVVSHYSSKNVNNETFFTGNKNSPWYLVTFGMIGATISGVTFISVPGEVGSSNWTYLQFLLGNFFGYWVIAFVLIPLYYRLNLISIYTYLDQRFGFRSYKTGASFFLISQTIGASFRLYLAICVLQIVFFDAAGIPFWLMASLTLLVIWLYTRKAGIKTVIWTDTIQAFFLISAVVITIIVIGRELNLGAVDMVKAISDHPHSQTFDWDWQSKTNFFKQFFAGIGVVFAMNGLDQNMMQKNLTCRTQKDAQKNFMWFSLAFIISNLCFLSLGVLLYMYADTNAIQTPVKTDELYPLLAMKYFGVLAGILFLIGILSAAYSSADSALTALTTSLCIDIFGVKPENAGVRSKAHIGVTIMMLAVILLFHVINNDSVVNSVFKIAGYTYGPLVGLFLFGILTKKQVRDKYVPFVCILSPVLCWIISSNSKEWFGGYQFGFELLLLNGLLTFVGLLLLTKSQGNLLIMNDD